jgi:transcriptional regulator with XRE-family HTH domain
MIGVNCDLIHRRRLALGLSKRQLARVVDLSQPVISRLEEGANPDLSKHNLVCLCEALSIHPGAILVDSAPEPVLESEDARKVEAALATFARKLSATELAVGLGWTLPRTKKALSLAQRSLLHTGMRLHCTAGRYGLRPAAGVLGDAEERALARTVIASVRISVRLAQLLLAVSGGKVGAVWEQSASNADRPLLGQLLNLGWVQRQGKRYRLAPEVAFSLAVPVSPKVTSG